MSEEEFQHQDLQNQERLALDCLTVIHKGGYEGTANTLAGLLGLSLQWRQQKDQRLAA